MYRAFLILVAGIAVSGCAGSPATRQADGAAQARATFPLQTAWHNGAQVFYITTDISDAGMASMMGSNFAPRLTDAVPAIPKRPGEKSALERVYKFTNDVQDAVFASIPNPIGPSSRDAAYSPLWQVFWVEWKPGIGTSVLKSEEAILAAEERGAVDLTRTSIVINCPIVGSPAGVLPGVVISRR